MSGHDIALIIAAAVPNLIGLLSLRSVRQIHRKVTVATNGQHDELVRGQAALLRRLEALEEEVGTAQSAIVATVAAAAENRSGWRLPFRR